MLLPGTMHVFLLNNSKRPPRAPPQSGHTINAAHRRRQRKPPCAFVQSGFNEVRTHAHANVAPRTLHKPIVSARCPHLFTNVRSRTCSTINTIAALAARFKITTNWAWVDFVAAGNGVTLRMCIHKLRLDYYNNFLVKDVAERAVWLGDVLSASSAIPPLALVSSKFSISCAGTGLLKW